MREGGGGSTRILHALHCSTIGHASPGERRGVPSQENTVNDRTIGSVLQKVGSTSVSGALSVATVA